MSKNIKIKALIGILYLIPLAVISQESNIKVLTPNAHGINDSLTLQVLPSRSFAFSLYNKWGELVYETKSGKSNHNCFYAYNYPDLDKECSKNRQIYYSSRGCKYCQFWDGNTKNGNNASEGLYYYRLTYQNIKDSKLNTEKVGTRTGKIRLKRPKKLNQERKNKAKLPPILSIQNIRLNKSQLEAGGSAKLKVTLQNSGSGKAYDVHAKLSSNMDKYLEFPSKKHFETIDNNGGQQTIEVSIKAKRDIPSSKARMDIQIVEPNFNVNIQGKRLVFETEKFKAPNVVLAKFKAQEGEAANPDKKIDVNERMKIKVLPQNVGKQTAKDVKINIENNEDGVIFLGCGESDNLSRNQPEFQSIDVGDYKEVTCHYFINSQFEGEQLKFTITGKEKFGEYGFETTKQVPINDELKAQGQIKKVEVESEKAGEKEVKIKELPEYGIDVEQNIPETSAKQPNTYALIIGNENYTKYQSSLSQESNVDFAKRDAEIFAKYVKKTLGVPSDNIRVKTNLTAATMKRQIEWLKTRSEYASDSVQLIFYYSGHGFPNPSSKEKYLMPVDVTGAQVTRGVEINKLYNQLTQNKTKRATLFLDACFSGAGREQGLLAAKSVKIEPKENAIMDGKLVAFSSSQGNQQSFFYKQKKHGLFTYYLLKKLKQTKGEVTYGKLYNYVKNKVPFQSTEIYGAEQVPGVKFSREVKVKWKVWQLK